MEAYAGRQFVGIATASREAGRAAVALQAEVHAVLAKC
ncbi:MAG: hypothetical protein QOG10_2250 [Kribbellaceae bacterium]|nr:hypothetical protein [Kribbellaceae bacterium]